MGEVLGIVYRVIAGHLVKKAGATQASARTGAAGGRPRLKGSYVGTPWGRLWPVALVGAQDP